MFERQLLSKAKSEDTCRQLNEQMLLFLTDYDKLLATLDNAAEYRSCPALRDDRSSAQIISYRLELALAKLSRSEGV